MGVQLARQRGFTLLELVVTLFVIALATAIVTPSIGAGMKGLKARAEVARFSAFLRRAHEHAITSREERTVTVDPAARVVTEQSNDQVRAQRPLPEGMAIEALPPTPLPVHFSPQGYSSGGTFRLSLASGIVYRVKIDPLTGRVTSRREIAR